MRKLILDTGPIVAALDRKDPFNRWMDDQIQNSDYLITTDAVITECFHLLKRVPQGRAFLVQMLRDQALHSVHHFSLAWDEILSYIQRYEDASIDFADACILHMSSMYPEATILTLDSEFRVFRRLNGSLPNVTLPPGR